MMDDLASILQVVSIIAAFLGFLLVALLWKAFWFQTPPPLYLLVVSVMLLLVASVMLVGLATTTLFHAQKEINVSVRDFLTAGKDEPTGFGLYSYLLFGNRGGTNRNERLAATKAYLNQFDAFRTTRVRSAKDQLNVFYMPTIVDAEWIDQCDPAPYAPPDPAIAGAKPKPRWKCTFEKQTRAWSIDELAEWIELKYHYQRSAELLQLLNRLFNSDPDLDGVYVASYRTPLMSKVLPRPDPNMLLLQRLSRVPADHLETWIEELRIQFAKPQYWDVATLRWIMLNIRSRFPAIAEKIDFIGPLIAKESLSPHGAPDDKRKQNN